MSEILVKAMHATHSDANKDRRGCYKAGMPVVVFDDGHVWGKEEGLPKFWIIKLPGVKKEDFRPYLEPETIPGKTPDDPPEIVRRRGFQFVLTPPLLNQLNRDGKATLDVRGWQNFLKRIGG